MDKNAVTIVTGGGRGIGRAIALRMAKETVVYVISRTSNDNAKVCEEIRQLGGRAVFNNGDVTDPRTAEAVVEFCLSNGLKVRNLICNAGIGKSGPTELCSRVNWDSVFNVNVNGTFNFIKACLPTMVENKIGHICLISSIAGLVGVAYDTAYSASKHALVGMAKSLAKEHGRNGIVTGAVCPHFVESEMTERTISSVADRNRISGGEAWWRVAKTNPQRRIIPAEEVAEMVAFVCGGKVPSLSGSAIVLAGGGV